MNLQDLSWPLSDLGHAFATLTNNSAKDLPAPTSTDALKDWVAWAALHTGNEATPVDVSLRELELTLRQSAPAIWEVNGCYLVVLKAGKRITVLAPDLSRQRVTAADVADYIRAPFESAYLASYQGAIASLGLSQTKQRRLIRAMLNEQAGDRHFRRAWTLQVIDESTSIWRGIPALISAHATQYGLLLASWAVLGTLTFSGHIDKGWIQAWALLLLTLIPFRLLTTWTQGKFAIRVGNMLKRRLLRGALRLEPEEVRSGGVGSFLGQALEAEAIETLAISGGISGLLAAIELIPSAFLLGRFSLALIAWFIVAIIAGWLFFKNFKRWTDKRLELTKHLVEVMVGHRTRLAQQNRADWHSSEDSDLLQYLNVSKGVDQVGSWLVAGVPRGWLLLGLICISPSLVAGHTLSSSTAVLLGGVLLSFSAFQRLVGSLTNIGGAIIGWQRVKPLFDAAARKESAGALPPKERASSRGQRILEADRLSFRYPKQATPALQGCSLSVRRGEHVLVEGPSGGGKTTLASLLTGLRHPESGLLLIGGLDRHTLGETAWRRQIASAPQFHENHVLTETLAFNLLMGRNWPPTNEDLAEAEQVCQELGLGSLLARMPSGIMQMVGEGGWQLSHGERSRLFSPAPFCKNRLSSFSTKALPPSIPKTYK